MKNNSVSYAFCIVLIVITALVTFLIMLCSVRLFESNAATYKHRAEVADSIIDNIFDNISDKECYIEDVLMEKDIWSEYYSLRYE